MRNKKEKKGLGSILYTEWLVPIIEYYRTIHLTEFCFDVIFPLLIAVITSGVYQSQGLCQVAAGRMAEILLTVTSILIGFLVMLITTLLTSDNGVLRKLKDNKVEQRNETLYQKLYSQLIKIVFSAIALLGFVLVYYFFYGIYREKLFHVFFLGGMTYGILHIILSMIRGMSNLFFWRYKE